MMWGSRPLPAGWIQMASMSAESRGLGAPGDLAAARVAGVAGLGRGGLAGAGRVDVNLRLRSLLVGGHRLGLVPAGDGAAGESRRGGTVAGGCRWTAVGRAGAALAA